VTSGEPVEKQRAFAELAMKIAHSRDVLLMLTYLLRSHAKTRGDAYTLNLIDTVLNNHNAPGDTFKEWLQKQFKR
jgi:hypothetical protein